MNFVNIEIKLNDLYILLTVFPANRKPFGNINFAVML